MNTSETPVEVVMTRKNFKGIAFFLLVCIIFMLIPVSALQSAEQSISDSLTRGSRFTITITGLPNTAYYVWLPGTFTMTGEPYDQPPVIADNQAKVVKDPSGGPYAIGSYQYNNGGGSTIIDDVAPSTADMSNTNYYAQVTTDTTGQAVVEFQTSVYTATRSYSVKVENPQAPESENFLVEQKTYSRSASRPMINTPTVTVATYPPRPSFTTSSTTSATLPPETLPVTTPVPATTPLPTRKSPLGAGIAALATGIGLMMLARKERSRQ
ncbi:MAG: hypothetical protein LUQ71_02195 [Methanoregula sp.]|nr:hypothetical protein [Methanoregula sp.]